MVILKILNLLKNSKQKKGFIHLGLAALLIIIALVFIGPKIMDKLEFIGIADDYIMHDDFKRGYFDTTLWDSDFVGGSWRGYPTADEPDLIAVNDGKLSYTRYTKEKDSGTGTFTYLSPNLVLYPKDVNPGMYYKTKIITREDKWSSYYYFSIVSLYINDVLAYTCKPPTDGINYACIIECIPSFENPDIYTIRVNGEDLNALDTTNPEGDNKFKIILSSGCTVGSCYYADNDGARATSWIDYSKYKVPYNCKIEDDEILLFDSYAAGSKVNISTLSHEPVKFCLDYPIKARSFEEDGIKTDIRGEILQKIVRGESTTVPDTEEWKIFYITKQTEDISLRCDIDEAFSTETGICENPAEQLIVGCQSDSDCYIPNGCTGLTCSCVNNELLYEGGCIFRPQQTESNMWDKIMSLSLMQWIAGLFS